MGQTVNPRLRRVLMEIVENQLRDRTPPETAETLARLVAEGHSRERAMELIACVVSSEVFDVLKNNERLQRGPLCRGSPRLASPALGGRGGRIGDVGRRRWVDSPRGVV